MEVAEGSVVKYFITSQKSSWIKYQQILVLAEELALDGEALALDSEVLSLNGEVLAIGEVTPDGKVMDGSIQVRRCCRNS